MSKDNFVKAALWLKAVAPAIARCSFQRERVMIFPATDYPVETSEEILMILTRVSDVEYVTLEEGTRKLIINMKEPQY